MTEPLPPSVVLVAASAACASALVWIAVARRVRRRQPVLPYEPHARVPWRAIDVAVVLVLFLCVTACISAIGQRFAFLEPLVLTESHEKAARNGDLSDSESGPGRKELEASHPLVVLIHESGSIRTFLFCALVGVVVAPIVEEFFFRLVLQGWLESLEGRMRRRVPGLRGLVRGTVAVVPTSLLFAAMHYRDSAPDMDPHHLLRLFASGAASGILALVAATVWIRVRTGATAADFGFVGEKFLADVRLGFLAFLALVTPIYVLQMALKNLLPEHPIVDPVSLFFFALVLGILYYRTHRIVPSIVAHMALNGFGLSMLWLWTGAVP